MTWWYISFAMDKEDGGFRGATVVEADNAVDVLTQATMLGLNPGGGAAILEIPKDAEREPDILAMRNKLLNREQMLAQGAKRHGDLPKHTQRTFEHLATHICSVCNEVGRCRCN